LPAQYSQFVPQHEDLKLFEVGRPAQQTKKLENALKNDVQDGQEHGTSYGRQPRGPLFYANRISAPHTLADIRAAARQDDHGVRPRSVSFGLVVRSPVVHPLVRGLSRDVVDGC